MPYLAIPHAVYLIYDKNSPFFTICPFSIPVFLSNFPRPDFLRDVVATIDGVPLSSLPGDSPSRCIGSFIRDVGWVRTAQAR